MPQIPDRTETLFAAAVALSSATDRQIFLDRECVDDPNLRKRLEALLRAHERAGHLLDAPVPHGLEQTQVHISHEHIGSVIAGRYKLLEAIGEGGMGTVWVAEQSQPVKRKVALKLIKAGMDSKSVLARFEAERQALAVMDHPNIAKVLDGGITESGRPFFVMEYVKGVPITEYCDATRMSVPDRLQLFAQVCQAVQHAHQKGIIHRDLKPSNILVAPYDDKPVPKVIDFGLAKAMNQSLTEHTLHTAHDMVLGTPLYMSPEQAQLNNIDVDTRSDIYSLGVLLYELLTGTTPLEKQRFKQAAWDEIRRVIREEEPPLPSLRLSSAQTLPSLAAGRHTEPAQLTKLVRGELDWIVMKALDKDRTRRYETANGFAADVNRYLAGEPVLAAPPSANYRLRKFAQKNRTVLTTAAVIAILFVTGTAVSVWQAVRATYARHAADESAREARANELKAVAERDLKEEALEAEKSARKQARDALNTMTDDVIQKVFSQQPTLDETQKAFLRKVMSFYESFATQSRTTEESRFLAADGKVRVAKILLVLGERPEAMAMYQDVIPELRDLMEEFPDNPEYIHLLAASQSRYGYYQLDSGDRAAAEPRLREALALQESLCTKYPQNAEYQYALGGTLHNMNILLGWLKRHDESEEAARREIKVFERLTVNYPDRIEFLGNLGNAHNQLCLTLKTMGQKVEAYTVLLRGIEILENAPINFRNEAKCQIPLCFLYSNTASSLMEMGKIDEAEKLRLKALELQMSLAERFPSVPDYRRDLARAYSSLAGLWFNQSRDEGAIDYFSQAIKLLEQNLQQDPRRATDRGYLIGACEGRAEALIRKSSFAEAIRDWNTVMKWAEPQDRLLSVLRRAISLSSISDASFEQAIAEAKREALASWTDRQLIDIAKPTTVQLIGGAYAIATQLKEPAKAAASVEMIVENKSLDGLSLYNAARVFAVCSKASDVDEGQKQKYADRAMEMLNQAAKLGWKNAAQLEKDTVFDTIRVRDDYLKLIKELVVNRLPGPKELEDREKSLLSEIDQKKSILDRFPSDLYHRSGLAFSFAELGGIQGKQSRYKESIESFTQAQRLLESNLQKDPDRKSDRGSVAIAYVNRADALIRSGSFANAIRDLNQAAKWQTGKGTLLILMKRVFLLNKITDSSFREDVKIGHREALEAWNNPQTIEVESLSLTDRIYWASVIARELKEPVPAATAVESILATNPQDTLLLYNSACVFALCSAASQVDEAQRQKYANRAMELLHQAIKAGWKDAVHIQKDSDLESLRDREDFKTLVEQLEALLPEVVENATQENSATLRGFQQSANQPQ